MKAITLIATVFVILFTNPAFSQNNGETPVDSTENYTGQVPIIQDRITGGSIHGFWETFSFFWNSPKAYFSNRKRLGL